MCVMGCSDVAVSSFCTEFMRQLKTNKCVGTLLNT